MASQEFNTSAIPLAFLITFRCYGTWLHGDDRGSTDRSHNTYGSSFILPNSRWENYNCRFTNRVPVTLDAHRRSVVEASVREACRIKRWGLHAVNVRTNHVHAVVSPTNSAERILSTLKANSTQRLRAAGCWESERSPWAGGGSKRYLWTERSVEMAINYVVNGQGGPLPDFSVE